MTTAEVNAYNARRMPQGVSAGGVDKESELHAAILDECRRNGWMAIHSRMDAPSTLLVGSPDFVILADGGRVFFIEAKARTGKLSEAQMAVHAWAKKLGHEIHVVRDFPSFAAIVRKG